MWFVPFSLRDLIDIVLVALIMYWLYRSTRGTNAPYILTGIVAVYMLWVVVRALNMELLSNILGQVISVGVIALIVVFQPEIRRFLHIIGIRQHKFGLIARLFRHTSVSNNKEVLPIVEAASALSRSHTGALIVITQLSDLSLISEGGVSIDAKLSTQLIRAILAEKSPLHDGAIVVDVGRIVAAKCILPVTQSEIPMSLGMRHRAAIGLSEVSDAIVVIVSEQTGQISLARSGQLTRDLSADDLACELLVCIENKTSTDDDQEVSQ